MKRTLNLIILLAAVFPLTVSASWWNPFTWNFFQSRFEEPRQEIATSTAVSGEATSTIVSLIPTTDDLNKRIAELEDKLEKAQLASKKATTTAATVKASTPAASTSIAPVSTSGTTQKQVTAKAKSAVVLVETDNGFASGTIIDAKGNILTNAHAVWVKDANGAVVGAADKITVTLSNGTKKSARLIGLDEASDLAIVQISGGSASYLAVSYDSGIFKGDTVYISGFPAGNQGSSGGSSFVAGTVVSKNASTIQVETNDKPLDTGGAMINSSGNLIGIPNKSSCKVLEEMTNCLKYTVTETSIRAILPKLVAGMQLYRDKKNETAEEILVKSALQSMYSNFNSSSIIDYPLSISTGKNSFDYFNSKLGADQDDKLTKLYLLKLKSIADGIYIAMDLFKSQSYALNILFINESANVAQMGNYERATIAKVQASNALKVKEYQAKVDLWSRKKNEYDTYLVDPSQTTHDYLMEQSLVIEKEIDYIKAERQKILDTYSGETVDIF